MDKEYKQREKEAVEKYAKTLTVKKKRNLVLGIIIGILIAGGAGFTGGYFATKLFNKSSEAETIKYIVEFETNGGSTISAIQIKKGDKLEVTKYQPTKSGCLFDGWYLDSELTTLCPKQLEVTQNTKIYAKWKNKISEEGLGYILNSDGRSYSVYMADEDKLFENSSNLSIPETYNGKPITSIGYYDEEKEIAYGFQGSLKLKGIYSTGGATQIAPYAFKDCVRLDGYMNFGSSLLSIGAEAFANCYTNQGVTFLGDNLIEIGEKAFINNYSLLSFSCPSSLLRIGKNAFANCSNMSYIEYLQNSYLQEISESCFENCYKLNECKIPASVVKIGANAFKYTDIKSGRDFTFADTFSTWSKKDETKLETREAIINALYNGDLIYKNPFYAEKDNLNFYILGKDEGTNDVYVSVANPQDSTKTEINIPKQIEYEYKGESLNLKVTRIAEYGFSDSKIITKVTIPSSVITIGANAFENSSKLATIEIGDSSNASELLAIGDNAFKSTAITGISLPNGLISIGDNAFCYTNIESINIPNTVTEIKDSTVIDSVTKEKVIHAPFYGCSKLENISITEENDHYYTKDGVLFSKIDDTHKMLLKFPQAKTCDNNEYALPNDIDYIANGAFYNVNKVTKISIPDETKLTYINDYAFSSSDTNNINEISISKTNSTLKYIGYQAFAKTKITSFNMPSTVTFLGGRCFEGCTNYKGQDVGEEVFKFVIPQDTLYIDTKIITGCSKILTREQVDFTDTNHTWTIYKDDDSIVEKEFNPIDTDGKVKNYALQMLKGEYGNRYWVKNIQQ